MKNKIDPIRPSEVVTGKKRSIPDTVFEAFNELIVENFNGSSATIKQKDIVVLMVAKGLNEKEIFKKGWLDVEDVYRSVGWKVEYDKPGFNETYDATFTFSPRKK